MGVPSSTAAGDRTKVAAQMRMFKARLRESAMRSTTELGRLKIEKRLHIGWKSLMGLKAPNCNATWAHVGMRPMLASELFDALYRHEAIKAQQPIGLIEVVDERWDTSIVAGCIDAESVRKNSRAALKKLLGKTSFTALHQARLLSGQAHQNGEIIIESRVLALIAGPATLSRAKEEAASLSQQMTSRTRRGDAITVREFGTRKRDLAAAIIEMLGPLEGNLSVPVDPMLDLRLSQVRATFMLKQTCFGYGKAQTAAAAALQHVEQEAKRLSKGPKSGVHRDGVPQFLAELNVAIGRPEWRSPFVKSRR